MLSEFHYDVFLSHSAKDKPVVRELAERLRKDGLKVWFDEWVLKPGDSIRALAYVSGQSEKAVREMKFQPAPEVGRRPRWN